MPKILKERKVSAMHSVELPRSLTCAYILPIADLHRGDPASNEFKLNRYIKWVLSHPNAYVVTVGDLANIATKFSVSDVYEDTETVKEQRKSLVRIFKPLADAKRLIGMVGGNHEHRLARDSGDDFTETVADKLNVPYFENEAWLRVNLGSNPKGAKVSYTMYFTHGAGGGKTIGGKANRLIELADITDVDIYVSAHTHQEMAFPVDFYVPVGNRIVPKKKMFVSTGSFLEHSGYATRALYRPTHVGCPRIRLDGHRRDFHVSL